MASHVQTGGSQPSGTQSSMTIAMGSPVTAGNLLVVGVSHSGLTQLGVTVSDNKGNTYSPIVSAGDGGLRTWIYLFATIVGTGGSGLVITITPGASIFLSGVADEFAFSGSAAVDDTSSAIGASGVTPIAPGDLTVSGTDMVYSLLGPAASVASGTISAGSGYTLGTAFAQSSNHIPIGSEYALDVTASPQAPGWSLGTNNGWVALGAAWKFEQSSASFIADHLEIPANRPRGVAVDLRGTGTSWVAGTTFTLSGVSGASVATKIVNSATSARLVIATGSTTGTLAISDGTNSTNVTVKNLSNVKRWFPGMT